MLIFLDICAKKFYNICNMEKYVLTQTFFFINPNGKDAIQQ